MAWGSDVWAQGIARMNRSVERANDLHDRRAYGMVDSEEEQRRLQAARQRQDMSEDVRRYDLGREEDRRRFDLGREDSAARRSQFDGLMKMLFGGGQPEQPGQMNALRFQVGAGGSPYGPPDDGIDRRSINNSLARYIRGGM